jgi:hypothetical protein
MDAIMTNGIVTARTLEEHGTPSTLLSSVDVPVNGADLALISGRRYELTACPEGDRLTVRGRGGAVLLRVLMTDAGPVLSFESADIEIAAAGKLAFSATDVSIEAARSLSLQAGGDCNTTVAGTRHTRVGATDRLEAAAIQLQASEGAAAIRAAGRIALDGEHIGLNDDPCPQPFSWSALAGGVTADRDAE